MISWFKGNDTALTLAKVLAEVDMISFDLLEQLYEEDYPEIEQLINCFESLSILNFYGPGGNNISLDGGVADYIRRSKLDLDPIMKSRIEEIIYNKIDAVEDDLGELSIFCVAYGNSYCPVKVLLMLCHLLLSVLSLTFIIKVVMNQ